MLGWVLEGKSWVLLGREEGEGGEEVDGGSGSGCGMRRRGRVVFEKGGEASGCVGGRADGDEGGQDGEILRVAL